MIKHTFEFTYGPESVRMYVDGQERGVILRAPGDTDETLQADLLEWWTMKETQDDVE